jgi:hypothetical protein
MILGVIRRRAGTTAGLIGENPDGAPFCGRIASQRVSAWICAFLGIFPGAGLMER